MYIKYMDILYIVRQYNQRIFVYLISTYVFSIYAYSKCICMYHDRRMDVQLALSHETS